MSLNKPIFYSTIKNSLFGGKLKNSQVQGMEAILIQWEKMGYTDLRKLSYMLATIYHETSKTMQPIEEYGKGKGYKYGIPDPITGKVYYGRGFVQLTWKANYDTMGKLLGVDLVNIPEFALDINIATKILFEGMFKGLFTGKRLDNYFNDTVTDPVSARKIINGTDRANLIAGYYVSFYKALTNS